jgi:hypothetical protein
LNKLITKSEVFTVSKTDNVFIEVQFDYPNGVFWDGCFPVFYPPKSLQFDDADLDLLLQDAYLQLAPESIDSNISKIKQRWTGREDSETFHVFNTLLTGNWQCRSCGAGKINDQPAARIRDIKKNGFIIATKSKNCVVCKKKQYHDILLIFDLVGVKRPEFRKPISSAARSNIIQVLESTDVFFNSRRPAKEFVIDHKFPSQRWETHETDNEQLTEQEIQDKFQLLTNQSNMLKSRLCDACVRTGSRPDFLGIHWFYAGGKEWVAPKKGGTGCIGCPWYDLKEWKIRLQKELLKGSLKQ